MPADNPPAARIVEKTPSFWENKHQNFSHRIDRLYDVWNPDLTGISQLDAMKGTVASLQGLVRRAIDDNVRIRAIGSGWSISSIAASEGRLINTCPLNYFFRISGESVSSGYRADPANLLMAQCGISILELNRELAARQRSLRASGASNGQTIVGAMSTGTHGSAIDVGAIQDFVVGMHVIVSPDRHVWIERESHPVTADGFAARLGADLIRDDELFNAVLVSFGSFGIIHAVMIETEPIFLLEAYRIRLPIDDALRTAINTLDLSALPLPHPADRPYHFEVVVNPYDVAGGAFVTVMYKRPYRADYPRIEPGPSGRRPGDDFLHVIGMVTDEVPGVIPGAVNQIVRDTYGVFSEPRWGTIGEIFGSTSIRGRASGSALGLPVGEAGRALDLALDVNDQHGPFAGVFALRFVPATKATLGFTRFDNTCVLDLDGVHSSRTLAFYRRVWQRFSDERIPFTLHWGKVNGMTEPALRAMYGESVDTWLAQRRGLLDADCLRVFSSPFTDSCGLSA
jgi:FAD/FMN-containing dehydrogenase